MSYETENRLPAGTSIRQVVEFACLLGFRKNGTYSHLNMPKTLSLVHFENKHYQSWNVIELSISKEESIIVVNTRTRVGRSSYDFWKQNQTVREFRKRFGGTFSKDGGNGEGYDPGPSIPPAASGCYLSLRRLEANLSRLSMYLNHYPAPRPHESMLNMQKIWPELGQYDPEIFSRNMLVPYLVASTEDFLKSSYVALLRYSRNKASLLKGARLSGEQLALIADGQLLIEEGVAETKSFQNLKSAGRNFAELESKLDILGPLRKPIRAKISLLDHLDNLTERRHALIHGMELDLSLNTKKLNVYVKRVDVSMRKIHREIYRHFNWEVLAT